MTMDVTASRAFAVWWKDFDYWQVRALRLALTNKCNWPTVRLGDVVSVRNEVVPEEELQDGRVNMLDRISFDEGRVFFGKRTATRMVQFRARPGDIVVSKINACKRAIGIVQNGTNVSATIHFRALVPNTSKVDTEFLWAALRSTYCLQQFEVETGGMGKGEMSEEKLLGIAVPLPPLTKQKAIVAHWRKAQDEIAATRERVGKGATTIDARFFADLGLSSPDKLTTPKAFAVLWEDFLRWGVGFNFLNQSGADLSCGKYPVAELGSLLDLVQYGTSEKANTNSDGVAVIRMNNVVDGQFDLTNLKHLRLPKTEVAKLALKEGDILFNRTNSKELVGKCAVFHSKGEYVFASYLIRIRAKPVMADADFLAYAINSQIGRQQINALSRQIIGQANINTVELRSLQIPLPPLTVQQQIMKRVASGRAEIAREREAVEILSKAINAEVEALILGNKSLKDA